MITVALVEPVTAGVMPPVVVTLTLGVQVPFRNMVPEVAATVKVSVCDVLLSVMVEEAGAMVQIPAGVELVEAVIVAGSVVGFAGTEDSAPLVVQVTLGVPMVTGLAGVQVSAGRLITGGAAIATVTKAAVVELGPAPVAVIVALAGPGVAGRLAGTIVIVRVCNPSVVEVGLSVIHGQGVVAAHVEVKFTVPLGPNCCSCVVNEVVAAFPWPMV